MFTQFIIEHQSQIFVSLIIFWCVFLIFLLNKPKTLKLGLFLILLSFCLMLVNCYHMVKNQQPNINSYKKICGIYQNNIYEPSTRGKGRYKFNFLLDGYGTYSYHINDTKMIHYKFESSKYLNLNILKNNQPVCLHVNFNIYNPNRINDLLDIEYIDSNYEFIFKKICGQQVATHYVFGMEKNKDNPYDLIFDLDHYGKYSLYIPPQTTTRSTVIGDVNYTNTHQRACLIAKIPKVDLVKQDYLKNSDILMIELVDKSSLQSYRKQ